MKQIIAISFFVATTFYVNAQPPQVPATPGSAFGAPITTDGYLDIKQLPQKLEEANKEIPIKLKGEVLDVCQKMGCWISLKVNDSTTAFVKMKDYAFFLPTAIKGKTVVLDAVASEKTTSVAELQHYAKDAKKTTEEINAITTPKKEIRILASGIVVIK